MEDRLRSSGPVRLSIPFHVMVDNWTICNSYISAEIHLKEEEVSKSKLEMARTSRELEDLKKKMVVLEKVKDDLTTDRAKLKGEIAEVKHLFGEQKHAALVERKKLDAAKQEVTALEHNLKASCV